MFHLNLTLARGYFIFGHNPFLGFSCLMKYSLPAYVRQYVKYLLFGLFRSNILFERHYKAPQLLFLSNISSFWGNGAEKYV